MVLQKDRQKTGKKRKVRLKGGQVERKIERNVRKFGRIVQFVQKLTKRYIKWHAITYLDIHCITTFLTRLIYTDTSHILLCALSPDLATGSIGLTECFQPCHMEAQNLYIQGYGGKVERVVERKEEMGRGMEKGIHEVEKEWRNDEGYI